MQTIIAISLLVAAGVFLSWNYIGKNLVGSAKDDESCGPNCKCS